MQKLYYFCQLFGDVTNMLIGHIPVEEMIGPIPVLFSPVHIGALPHI